MIKFVYFLSFLTLFTCNAQNDQKSRKDQIIQEHIYDCADKINFYKNLDEYQECIDEGIKKDSTIAYLWQQKAMPYFKLKQYETGMKHLDKAVILDSKRYLAYRAFIKCIFVKDYKDAIIDFQECINNYGDSFEMDHSYTFYIGLSQLQLKDFIKAESSFEETIWNQKKMFSEAHHLDLFYLGVTKYELGKYQEAITIFDEALNQYPKFSDVIYYKALALNKIKENNLESSKLLELAKEYASKGFTINEDNAIYEDYPYKVKW